MKKVFLCVISGDASVPDGKIPPARAARMAKISNEAVRRQSMNATAAFLRAAEAVGIDPDTFFYGENGKPGARGGYVSVSHTDGTALCAASDVPVGADIERADRYISEGVARRMHAKGETGPLLGTWVAKEAYLKMTGEGLGGDMRRIRAGEDGIFDGDGKRLAYLTVFEKLGCLVAVCCGEEFIIEEI